MSTKTLGELITILRTFSPDRHIEFDFCQFRPGALASWRGSYAYLAIEPEAPTGSNHVTVGALLKRLMDADGKTYDGYKGGEFTMGYSTPVWVDEWGTSTCTGIVGIGTHPNNTYDGCSLIIQTAPMEFE